MPEDFFMQTFCICEGDLGKLNTHTLSPSHTLPHVNRKHLKIAIYVKPLEAIKWKLGIWCHQYAHKMCLFKSKDFEGAGQLPRKSDGLEIEFW